MLCHHRISALVVVFLLSWCDLVSAHSLPPRALKSVSHPETLALEILPRQQRHSAFGKRNLLSPQSTTLRHNDSFRLVIAAFEHRFFLHLAPNDDLIHPSARLKYHRVEGGRRMLHNAPLLRESVKAYWGVVMPEHVSAHRMREDAAGVLRRPYGGPELGWARIMVHHQGDVDQGIAPVFEGAFSVNGIIHHVMTKANYLRNKRPLDPEIARPLNDIDSNLVIWRDSDIMSIHEQAKHAGAFDAVPQPPRPQTCGHDSLPYNTDPSLNPTLQQPLSVSPWYSLGLFDAITSSHNDSLLKRDDIAGGGTGTNFVDTINNTSGCPKTQKVLYMGVAADCVYTSNYDSEENATTQILTNWNTAGALYKSTFNVSLGIVELAIQGGSCPSKADSATPWNIACSSDVTLNERLSLFSQWRGDKGNDGAGLWHLMSGCPTGSEVGIAWLSTLCQQTASGSDPSVVSGTAVSTAGRTEWQVVAHEIGHNFGAIHDCTDGCSSTTSCCPLTANTCNAGSQFLMSPVAEAGEMNFSPCSVGNVCSLMQGTSRRGTNTSCLLDPDPNRKTIALQMCGNGIVEAGEECDPGNGVSSSCCDSQTCKFTSNAVCDPSSSPCCTAGCSFAPSSQVCRPSQDSQCDKTEMCTGNSSACPTDLFAPNGQSCGSDDLKCAGGTCTSLAKQCQAAGASMNLQQACPNQNSNTCLVSCQDPNRANQCVVLQTQLIDGSPCGYGGVCAGGNCQAGNALNTVKAWYTQNLQISIPVTIVVALVLIFLIWALITGIRRCCTQPRSRSVPAAPMQKLPSEDPFANRAGWVPPSLPRPLPPTLQPESSAAFAQSSSQVPDRSRMDRLVPPSALSPSIRRDRTSRSGGQMRELILSPGVTRPPEWVDAALYNGRGR